MEIKEIQEEINKKIREASLTKDEKSAMFERIINSPRPSPYVFILSRWKFASRSFIYAAICIVFVFASGSGVISYSSSALPGESLYNFKVGIVEPAQGTFTFTSISQARLEADRAIRRLDEAEKLVSKNDLTPEHRMEVENRFKRNADNFYTAVESIEKDSASGANDEAKNLRSSFEKSLNDRAENLKRNSEKPENEKQKEEIIELENTVRGRVEQSSRAPVDNGNKK